MREHLKNKAKTKRTKLDNFFCYNDDDDENLFIYFICYILNDDGDDDAET